MTQESEKKSEKSWTVGELLAWTSQKLESIGVPDARVDAEHLLAHALGCRRLDLYLQHHRLLAADERSGFRELVRRRLTREPVAYIEGKRGFHGLDLELHVDRRVLIPRPDTEHLVDWLLEELCPANLSDNLTVLDVGTGSGAIALAVAHSRPDVSVWAIDTSEGALAVARENSTRLNLPVSFFHGDLLCGVEPPPAKFAAVAANLPYIPSSDVDGLAPEVRSFEPRLALDGGKDGLDLVRRLIADFDWDRLLRPGAALFLEIGIGQAQEVAKLLRSAGWRDVAIRADYGRIERVVMGRRSALPPHELQLRDARGQAALESDETSQDHVEAPSQADSDDATPEWVSDIDLELSGGRN